MNQPDINSGYTLDDNARALIAACMHYKTFGDGQSIDAIRKYLAFIKFCQQADGNFLNYVDKDLNFTIQNDATNLDDSNGRAIWALGYLISFIGMLPMRIISDAEVIIKKALLHLHTVHSTRAMAFTIKGLYFYNSAIKTSENIHLVKTLANRMLQMYRHEATPEWQWFESYLTYANSILPEAMLLAWQMTGDEIYKETAVTSFQFLLSQTFNAHGIEVISNKNWLQKGAVAGHFGEQPIDVAPVLRTGTP